MFRRTVQLYAFAVDVRRVVACLSMNCMSLLQASSMGKVKKCMYLFPKAPPGFRYGNFTAWDVKEKRIRKAMKDLRKKVIATFQLRAMYFRNYSAEQQYLDLLEPVMKQHVFKFGIKAQLIPSSKRSSTRGSSSCSRAAAAALAERWRRSVERQSIWCSKCVDIQAAGCSKCFFAMREAEGASSLDADCRSQ